MRWRFLFDQNWRFLSASEWRFLPDANTSIGNYMNEMNGFNSFNEDSGTHLLQDR